MKDPAVPSLSISKEGDINITISSTDAQVSSQGYSYNQAGFTYNQTGATYGGVYNTNQDIVPLTLTFEDIYTSKPTPQSGPFSLGPGFFLFLPQ